MVKSSPKIRDHQQPSKLHTIKMKIKSTAISLFIAFVAAFSFTGCSNTDTSNNVKMHEMGGSKPSYPMQDKDMPGRNN